MTSHGHENSHGHVNTCCAGFPQYPPGREPVRCYCAGTSGTVATKPEDHCAECKAAGCAESRIERCRPGTVMLTNAVGIVGAATSWPAPSCPFCGTSGIRDDWNREWKGVDPAKLRGGYVLKDGETFERDVLPIRCRAKYQQHIETIRRVARKHGYAIGVHGSIRRDIDLIAAPWTEEASDGETLAGAIADAVDGVIDMGSVPGRGKSDDHLKPEARPHGRMCWTIHLGGGPYIDLSVMPRREATS